jgi:hypothetical protein
MRYKYGKGQTIELPNKDLGMVIWLSRSKEVRNKCKHYFFIIIIY